MTSSKPIWALCVFACLWLPSLTEAADDVASLRAELQALKDDYTARVGALESRIAQLESGAAAAAVPTPEPPPPVPSGAAGRGASAFNPAISLILAGNYTNTSQDPESWRIAGFIPSGGEVGPGGRSFNLGESELAISASVDPYFSANLIAAIAGENEIGVEEAYVRTSALPSGFTVKGGRFFSGFGYLNEVHAHAWDFIDQPLVYQAMFAGQMAQDGLQLKWLAPTDMFLEFGLESGNGQEFPGTRRNRNGLNGLTVYGHLGGDLGDFVSWRAGASWLEQHSEDREFEDVDRFEQPVVDAFTGKSRTWVVDAVLKWTPTSTTRQQVKLQGEYLHRTEDGALVFDATGVDFSDSYRSTQSGWYLQGVYQFLPRWRAGLRYDALDSGTPRIGLVDAGTLDPADFASLLGARPDRITLMFDWNPSEFSRLRAQYAWDDARDTGASDRQFRLQYLFSIGAHGAHKY